MKLIDLTGPDPDRPRRLACRVSAIHPDRPPSNLPGEPIPSLDDDLAIIVPSEAVTGVDAELLREIEALPRGRVRVDSMTFETYYVGIRLPAFDLPIIDLCVLPIEMMGDRYGVVLGQDFLARIPLEGEAGQTGHP